MKSLKSMLVVLILLISYYSYADKKWENPIFVNNTHYTIKDITIKTQAQGDAKSAEKDNRISNIINPYETHTLKGELGGYFENSCLNLDQTTEWNIEIKGEDKEGNIHYLYSKRVFNNQCSDGPALSFWPIKFELSDANSKFILITNNNELFLRLKIYAKDGTLSNAYDFSFDEKWVETPNGRTVLSI